MKYLFVTAMMAVLSLASPFSNAAEFEVVDSEAEANLVIYRDKNDRAGRNIYYRLSVDGKFVGKLRAGKTLYLRSSAEEHLLAANDPKRTSLRVSLGNATRYVVASIDRKHRLTLAKADDSQWQASLTR